MKSILALLLTLVTALAALPPSLAAFTATSVNGQTVTSHPDWTSPVVTLTVPAGPLRGEVTTQMTASDADSAVESSEVQLRAVGSTTWVTRCTLGPTGGSCAIPTGVYPDGSYELRAVAVDTYGNVGTSAVRVRVFDSTPPAVTLADPGALLSGTVTLTATATDATSGVADVRFLTSPAGGETWTERCADATAPYVCELDTRTLADGRYDLRAEAIDAAGNAQVSVVTDRRVDNSALAVAVKALPAAVKGKVTVTADVVASGYRPVEVTIQHRLVGSSTWTTICTVGAAPYSCLWDTDAVAEGHHEVRATASDGSQDATSTSVQTLVDRTPPTVTLQDPGSPMSGTVTIAASAADHGSGVASVRIQFRAPGSTSWQTRCTVPAPGPYTCPWDTSAVADADYGLRALAEDRVGNVGETPELVRAVRNSVGTITRIAATSATTETNTLTLPRPAGVEAGDIMIAQVTVENSVTQLVNPTGWTVIASVSETSNIGMRTYWRRVGTSEPTSYSFGTSGKKASGGIVAYRGVNQTAPIDISGSGAGNATQMVAPSVSTSRGNGVVVALFGNKAKTAAHAVPPGMSRLWVTTDQLDFRSSAADEPRPTAGPTGTRSAGASTDAWVAQTVALRAADQ
jgi:hypothetical protein